MKLLCMIAVFLCIPWVASDAQKQDWGNLKRYAEANKELVRKGIHDIDLSGLRLFRESRHTHDLAHDDNDHLGSVIDDYISYF